MKIQFVTNKFTRFVFVCAFGILFVASPEARADRVDMGSHKASRGNVSCAPGTIERVDNWARACVLDAEQTFDKVIQFNGDQPPTTEPVVCPAGVRAEFDEYGWLVTCN